MIEINNYTILISTTIIIIGWFVNSWLNRRHEISKKRLDFRLEMLHSFLPVFISITSSKEPFKTDKSLNEKIMKARIKFQLYGLQDEINLFHKFTDSIDELDISRVNNHLNELIQLIRTRLRKELKIPNASLN